MENRIDSLKRRTKVEKYRFCFEKAKLFTEEYQRCNDQPEIIRTAMAQAYMLDHIGIYIAEGELIVGSPASKEMGIEADFWNKGVWTDEGIDSLVEEGNYEIHPDTAKEMKNLSRYWRGIITDYKVLDLYDEEMWNWKRSGFLLPPGKSYESAAGNGFAGNGYTICGDAADINQLDYGFIIKKGFLSFIADAEKELASMTPDKLVTADDYKKVEFLKAALIMQRAVIRFANRFADLAEQQAETCTDVERKRELSKIAETCRWVPANTPRNFQEAIQSFWFLFLMIVNRNTTPLGRFDQYMLPYYEMDKAHMENADEHVLELLQCLRIKFMQLKSTSGGATRKKWSGFARWNNMTIGGVTPEGKDATNPLSYLVIEAANRCRVPHHTITLRVHKDTPAELMQAALRLVRTGLGMPAFVGDRSYIQSMLDSEVPLEKARDYYMIGCIDPNVPEGFGHIFSMIVPPLAFDTYLHNGRSPWLNMEIGPKTGDVRERETYESFVDGFIEHLDYYLRYHAKDNAMRYFIGRDILPDAFTASLFTDGIQVGKIGRYRDMPYKLGPTMDIGVGAINLVDSLYAIRELVYKTRAVTMKELLDALDSNWEGERGKEIRDMCVKLPKFGNNNSEVDEIAQDLYHRMTQCVKQIDSYRGGKYNAGGISITAYEPGGALVGATPDGRYAGETLADGCLSPAQGKDKKGPTAALNSALRVNQDEVMSMLMNMKVHPSALKTEEDLSKLGMLIKTYCQEGGKHIQFNVVNKETLEKAQEKPEEYEDLVVRVAGYSAYFIQLSKVVQRDIIDRTEHELN